MVSDRAHQTPVLIALAEQCARYGEDVNTRRLYDYRRINAIPDVRRVEQLTPETVGEVLSYVVTVRPGRDRTPIEDAVTRLDARLRGLPIPDAHVRHALQDVLALDPAEGENRLDWSEQMSDSVIDGMPRLDSWMMKALSGGSGSNEPAGLRAGQLRLAAFAEDDSDNGARINMAEHFAYEARRQYPELPSPSSAELASAGRAPIPRRSELRMYAGTVNIDLLLQHAPIFRMAMSAVPWHRLLRDARGEKMIDQLASALAVVVTLAMLYDGKSTPETLSESQRAEGISDE